MFSSDSSNFQWLGCPRFQIFLFALWRTTVQVLVLVTIKPQGQNTAEKLGFPELSKLCQPPILDNSWNLFWTHFCWDCWGSQYFAIFCWVSSSRDCFLVAPHRWDYRLDMLCTVNISMSMSMYMNMDMYVYVHMYYILCLGSNPGFPSCPLSFIRHMIAHFLLILLVGIGSRRRVTMLIVTCSFLGYPSQSCLSTYSEIRLVDGWPPWSMVTHWSYSKPQDRNGPVSHTKIAVK